MTTQETNRKFTIVLDQVSSTEIEWCSMLLKEMGVPNPKIREIIARAIDTYTELLEDLAITFSCQPNAKVLKEEVYQVMMLSKERRSSWGTLDLPKIDLESFGAFPRYSTLAKQFHNPIPALPRVKKPKKASMNFADLKVKHHPPLPDPEFTQDQPFDLTSDPEAGKLLFNKSSN